MGLPGRIGPVIAVTGSSLMVGCGDYGGACGSYGSYGSYGGCAAPSVNAAGIYEGSLSGVPSAKAQVVVAIIADNGEGRMSLADDTYYRLNVTTDAANFSSSFSGYSRSGSLPNGAQSISGTIAGTVASSNLSLNATLTGPDSTQQSLMLGFDNTYNLNSSLANLAGNWTATVNGVTLTATIQQDGSFTGADSNNCTYSGAFTLIDANFNAYAESHARTCSGVNVTFTGLAAFFPGTGSGVTGTPTQIKLLTDSGAGDYLVAVFQ